MPDPIPAADQAVSAADEAVLQRRRFLRGSALLAAAAGGAVAASAGSVLPASADPVVNPYTLTVAVPPERLLDTRTSAGREVIVGSSSDSALDSKNRLKKGAWIDVAVATTADEVNLASVFVNLKSLDSTSGGSLVVSEPGDKPTGTTLTFNKGRTTTNSAIVGLAVDGDNYTVRIFATATGHVTLDVTGATIIFGDSAPEQTARTTETNVSRLAKAVRSARG